MQILHNKQNDPHFVDEVNSLPYNVILYLNELSQCLILFPFNTFHIHEKKKQYSKQIEPLKILKNPV